jgi:hypothetical protein
MKKPFNPVIPDYTPKGKVEDIEKRITLEPCVECGKPIEDGYYGRWKDGGVCSKTCNILHMKKREGEP